MQECAPLVSLGPLIDIMLYLNKPKIIGNGGELIDLDNLQTENAEYLQNADTQASCLFRSFRLYQNTL